MRTVKGQGTLPGMPPFSPAEKKSRKKTARSSKKEPAEQPSADPAPENDGWPPMAEMLHNVVVFEPAVHDIFPVTVLGVGAESEDIRQMCGRLLEEADVVCAGRGLLEAVAPEAQDDERFLPLTAPVAPVVQRIGSLYAAGKRVLVLANGDPLYFGIGTALVRSLGVEAVRVIPAVSILQLVCARMGLEWHAVASVSLHGRDNFDPLNAAAGRGVPVCALTDDLNGPDVLAKHLLERGADWFEAHIFENLGTDQEQEHHLDLAQVPGRRFAAASTTLLVPNAPVRCPYLGLAEKDLAIEGGVFTKAPVRAAALSLLRIKPRHTVWDIGAGSGVVALEACALAHAGRVTAVEQNAVRAVCARENRRRFGAAVLDVCEGRAPECLSLLPDPDCVFIGGGLSGEDGMEILNHVWERLPSGGRVAAACVLLDTLDLCRGFFENWGCRIVQVQASVAEPLGQGLHLAARNPVFIVAAQK
ncbi:MAG: precorrin-6y C5,15-methyltransferase (decarboxylating) subunit CbiE [Desulfovibrio sp.]|jgi:precorrin-6Y C5,15-methyltransferase (decarboxylating)|nr:precorrin-6y C5,15-methyltransferase (decarboxylating) subunit CbiE [Desulfovibrio sp.]